MLLILKKVSYVNFLHMRIYILLILHDILLYNLIHLRIGIMLQLWLLMCLWLLLHLRVIQLCLWLLLRLLIWILLLKKTFMLFIFILFYFNIINFTKMFCCISLTCNSHIIFKLSKSIRINYLWL